MGETRAWHWMEVLMMTMMLMMLMMMLPPRRAMLVTSLWIAAGLTD